MKLEDPFLKEWTLSGETDPGSITRRQGLLDTLFKDARDKGIEIAQLRQKNLNLAIIIFAALFTFSFRFSTGWYSVAVSAALVFIMGVFSILDRRFHKFIHGFRASERHLTGTMVALLNEPSSDLVFRRYISAGKKTAEWRAWQPIITYALVVVSVFHLIYCLIIVI